MDDQTAGGAGRPEPPPELPRADPIAGELVTETLEYDGGRQVTVYVPPSPPEAVVFAGDGQSISRWGGFLEAADVAGRREPFFLENATRWVAALRDAGADVVMTERVGSHGDAFWPAELPLMVAWAFGR